MSKEYDDYLREHRSNLCFALEWLRQNLPDVIKEAEDIDWYVQYGHDQTKEGVHEYRAYDKYFYGNNPTYAVQQDFRNAWLHHIHHNPHHWQHWVLINDDPEEGTIALEMPYYYIIEMICDWWSFSWAKDDLTEIFRWYDEHRDHMLLAKNTRKTVEGILGKMAEKLDYPLDKETEFWHHGIKGQKWGVQNGPPYPLGEGDKSAEKKAESPTSNGAKKESALSDQGTVQLEKGIRSLQKRLDLHKEKIENPGKFYPEWNDLPDDRKEDEINHWKKEISNFQKSIETRKDELRKRGTNNE